MKLIDEVRRDGRLSDPSNTTDQSTARSSSEELNEYILAEKESLEYDIAAVDTSKRIGDRINEFRTIVQITLPSQEEIMRLSLEEKKKNLLNQYLV